MKLKEWCQGQTSFTSAKPNLGTSTNICLLRHNFHSFFFSSPSRCTGITSSSEDSSELWFLLVENYNYIDCFSWISIRLGIFDTLMLLSIIFSLLSSPWWQAVEKRNQLGHYVLGVGDARPR